MIKITADVDVNYVRELKVIYRDSNKSKHIGIYKLEEREVEILLEPADAAQNEYDQVVLKLKNLRQAGVYFLCYCSKQSEPSLIPVLKDSTIFLRCHEREKHVEECDFFMKGKDQHNQNVLRPRRQKKIYYGIYGRPTELAEKTTESEEVGTENKSIRLSKIGSVFYDLLDGSKINEVTTGENIYPVHQSSQYKKIRTYAIKQELCKGCSLKGKFFSFLNDENINIAQTMMLKWEDCLERGEFSLQQPKIIEPTAYFLTPADRIDLHKKEIFSRVYNIYSPTIINKKIFVPSRRINLDKIGTFLVLMSARLKNRTLIFSDAFAMPIIGFKNDLTPVDSYYEKDVLNDILEFVRGKNIKTKITKPLFAERDSKGNLFHADLLIEINGASIFIEVLGSNDAGYLNRKMKIKQIASKYYDYYFSINCFKDNNSRNADILKIKNQLIFLSAQK